MVVTRARFAQCSRLALTTPRGSRSLGEKYHDNCGCTVAEVFDDWEPSYAERQQKALYEEPRKACKEQGLEPNTKNILAQMRELGDGTIHDAHVPEGEKKKPGRKPKTGPDARRNERPLKVRGRRGRLTPGGAFGGKPPLPPWPYTAEDGESEPPPWWTEREFNKVWHGVVAVRPNGRASLHGGHKPGKGWRGKTEFPPDWDRERVERALRLTWQDPDAWAIAGDRVIARRTVDGVLIEVTAYGENAQMFRSVVPVSGAGVVRNTDSGRIPVPLDEAYLDDGRWTRREGPGR